MTANVGTPLTGVRIGRRGNGMGENSSIEWCHHTFNPFIGCTKVSGACRNCYAETLMDKRLGKVKWGKGQPRVKTSPANWAKPLAWNKKAEAAGERHRVFCASLADVFDDEVPDLWRVELFEVIEDTPHLDWLLLTKRNEYMRNFLEVRFAMDELPPNIWAGVTVEDQAAAEERTPILLDTPAAKRFLSGARGTRCRRD